MKRAGSATVTRQSTGGLAANFGSLALGARGTHPQLEHIESEYIKNLQQQVYFLELEANYLREQARKATEMHPQMTTEAERMLGKLRNMQSQLDGLKLENKRQQANVDIAKSEQEKLISRLKAEDESHSREKRVLMDELVLLKREKEILERDTYKRDDQVLYAKDELDRSALALRNAETKISLLKSQLDQKEEQQRLFQSSLEEKRQELLKTETMLREVEDKYYSSTTKIQDQTLADFRTEVTQLNTKLKEAELTAEHDHLLRQKLGDESGRLVKENAIINQQLAELNKQLLLEKQLRESNEERRAHDITELVGLRDANKQQGLELNQLRAECNRHQEQCAHLFSKLSRQEKSTTSVELSLDTTRSKIAELEAMTRAKEEENALLRHDKTLLVDHVAELQKQMNGKERDLLTLHAQVHQLETQIKEVEHLKGLESTLHTQKWEEFSRLADNMKHLSRSLATSQDVAVADLLT